MNADAHKHIHTRTHTHAALIRAHIPTRTQDTARFPSYFLPFFSCTPVTISNVAYALAAYLQNGAPAVQRAEVVPGMAFFLRKFLSLFHRNFVFIDFLWVLISIETSLLINQFR